MIYSVKSTIADSGKAESKNFYTFPEPREFNINIATVLPFLLQAQPEKLPEKLLFAGDGIGHGALPVDNYWGRKIGDPDL